MVATIHSAASIGLHKRQGKKHLCGCASNCIAYADLCVAGSKSDANMDKVKKYSCLNFSRHLNASTRRMENRNIKLYKHKKNKKKPGYTLFTLFNSNGVPHEAIAFRITSIQ